MDTTFSKKTLEAQADFLRNLARSLLGEEQGAADLAQSVHVGFLQAAPRSLRSPRAWLSMALRRRGANLIRDEAARRRAEQDAAHAEAAPDPTLAIDRLELQQRVVQAVLALDEKYREVIDLRYYENLSPTAIAKRLVIPVSTVKTRLQRAIERLRQRLDGTFDGDRDLWCAALAPLIGKHWIPGRGAPIAASPVVVGTLLVSTKMIVGGAALALALGGWFLWPDAEESSGSGNADTLGVLTPSAPSLEGSRESEPRGPSRSAIVERQLVETGRTTSGIPVPDCAWLLSGTVRDQRGEVVPDTILKFRFWRPLPWEVTTEPIRTDEQGRYLLPLNPPKAPVSARVMTSFAITGVAKTPDHRVSSSSADLPDPVVGSALPVQLDFKVTSRGGVSGRILNDRGKPVAGARVTTTDSSGEDRREGRTDEQGDYFLSRWNKSGSRVVVAWHSAEGFACSEPWEATAGDIHLGDLRLRRTNRIQGVLRYPDGVPIANLGFEFSLNGIGEKGESTRDRLEHPSGPPVPELEPQGSSKGRASTDADGRFEVDGLLPGTYSLVMTDGILCGPSELFIGEAGTGRPFDGTLALHSLRLFVEDEEGLALPGARISMFMGHGGLKSRARGIPASYQTWVAPGDWILTGGFRGTRSAQQALTIGPEDWRTQALLTLDFTAGLGRLQLAVEDEAGREVRNPGLRLTEMPGEIRYQGGATVPIDAAGLSDWVPSGTYRYLILTEGSLRGTSFEFEGEGMIEVHEGETAELEATLRLGGRLWLESSTSDGGHASIRCEYANLATGGRPSTVPFMIQDPNGTTYGPAKPDVGCAGPLLEPGRWSIRLFAEGYNDYETIVLLRAAEFTPLEVELRRH